MFYDVFIKLCDSKSVKPTPLLKSLRVSPSISDNWKIGGEPNAKILKELADYFDVSVDYLLGRDEKKEAQPDRAAPLYSAEEQKLIEIYKRCPKETQMVIMNMMNGLAAELDTKNGDSKLTADKLA